MGSEALRWAERSRFREMGETQISRSDRWVKKPRLRYEAKRLSGGPAAGNRGGLVAPPCKNNHKLVCDLCPPRGSVQYEEGRGGRHSAFRCGVGQVSAVVRRTALLFNTPVPFSTERHRKSLQPLSSAEVQSSVSALGRWFLTELQTVESEKPGHGACRLALVGKLPRQF